MLPWTRIALAIASAARSMYSLSAHRDRRQRRYLRGRCHQPGWDLLTRAVATPAVMAPLRSAISCLSEKLRAVAADYRRAAKMTNPDPAIMNPRETPDPFTVYEVLLTGECQVREP
jgi:hypothetical protein